MPTIHLDTPSVSFLFATDLHLAAMPPRKRRGHYRSDMLAKLAFWSRTAAVKNSIALCGGDVWHVKTPTSRSNSLGLITEVIHAFGSFPGGVVYGVVGNHDVTGDNLATLPDQPLGVLMSSGVYHPVGADDEDPCIFVGTDGVRVRVDMYDWMPGEELLAQLQACVRRADPRWDRRVAVVHAFQQPGTSGSIFSDFALGHDDLRNTDYDVICYGHDHSRKGIIRSPKGGPIHVQLGSLSRAALAYDEVNRPVSLALIEFDFPGTKVTEIQIPVKPLELAFHTADLVVEQVDKRDDVKTFFRTLEVQAREVQSEDPLEILGTLTTDTAIIDTIKEVCELG